MKWKWLRGISCSIQNPGSCQGLQDSALSSHYQLLLLRNAQHVGVTQEMFPKALQDCKRVMMTLKNNPLLQIHHSFPRKGRKNSWHKLPGAKDIISPVQFWGFKTLTTKKRICLISIYCSNATSELGIWEARLISIPKISEFREWGGEIIQIIHIFIIWSRAGMSGSNRHSKQIQISQFELCDCGNSMI